MRRNKIGFLLAGALLFLAPAGRASASPAVHQVIIDKLAFQGSPAEVHVGDTVEWVNRDIFLHSATASDKSFDVDIPPNSTARIVIRRAGTIAYICKYHPGMKAEIVAK